MAEPSSLRVLETCRVAPPPETATSAAADGGETSMSLTFFDMQWLKFPPVERLFFYEFPHPPSSFFDSVLPKLKQSLSLTLHTFLPLAGNITWPLHSPKPIITFVSGDAVSLTVAESDSDFNHLSGSGFSESEETQLLIPHLAISEDQASILALQITLFPNSGFSIGFTTHHAAMDGKSSTLFIKSWAYICSNLKDSSSPSLPGHLIPFYDRSVIKPPSGIDDDMFANPPFLEEGQNKRSLTILDFGKLDQAKKEKLVRGTFELTPSSIVKLKKSAESKVKKKVHISTFSVTCAHVLECLVKAEKTEQNRVLLIINADCRSRLNPPIPATYFGNCITGVDFVMETKDLLEEDGFVSALEGISEALKKLENGVVRRPGPPKNKDSDAEEIFFDFKNIRMLAVAGSPRFEVYGNDFGWGRPKKVEVVSIGTGAFSLSDSKNGNGGIEVGLMMKEPQMKTFASLFLKAL